MQVAVLLRKFNYSTTIFESRMSRSGTTPRAEKSTSSDIDKTRDLKFKYWLQTKALKEKAFEYLGKLNPVRAEDRESLKEVAIALAAIEKALSLTESTLHAVTNTTKSNNANDPAAKAKSLEEAWKKWTREHHSFNNVVISPSELSQLSGAVHEFLDKVQDPDTGKEICMLPSLKCFFQAVPKPNEKAKPLSNDQKVQNAIFSKECKKLWAEAKSEMEDRVAQQQSGRIAPSRESEEKSRKETEESKEAAIDLRGAPKPLSQILNDMSIKVLREWIEEDEDKALLKQKQELEEKLTSSKKSHEQFVKVKDSLRIRLPSTTEDVEIAAAKPARLMYGRALTGVRPQKQPQPMTTVELMAGSGLKYVHATDKGRNGMVGDLERSRQKLLQAGFVSKENFDDDPDSRFSMREYRTEKTENKTILGKQAAVDKAKETNAKAYEDWLLQKELKDQAVKYLAFVPSPKGSVVSSSVASTALLPMLAGLNRDDDSDFSLVVNVGRALKKVDRSLLQEWTRWCNGFFPGTLLAVLWDYFPPLACDVHSAAYSQIKDTFLKLLRPGLDYQETFKAFFDRKWAKMLNSASNTYNDEDREKMEAELSLSKKDMSALLRQMGVTMNDNEMRALIDAFDANGDGQVTMSEFLSFVGPKRDKKGGAALAISQRCSWVTTCKRTGMAHAYTISEVKDKAHGSVSESKEDDAKTYFKSAYRATELITLKNGEKRLRLESAERKRREQVLSKCGLLDGDEEGKEDYDDDYDHDDEYGEDGDHAKDDKKGGVSGSSCDFAKWTNESRKEGLKYLADITKVARQESTLKELISQGDPPKAPQFWIGKLGDLDVGDEDDLEVLTEELLLRWAPVKNDLVSFFSIEFGGPVGATGRTDTRYKEIYRDPTDSNIENEFKFKYWVRQLKPCTGYLFRIRGINGYGPGDFTYKTFWTRPQVPIQPKATACTSDSATLRWVFSELFTKKEDALRALFNEVDADLSGSVSREELKKLVEDRLESYPELAAFLRRLNVSLKLDADDFGALFDMIEGDDDNCLCWEEFEVFFMNAGWGSESIRASQQSAHMSLAVSGGQTASYIVSRCQSELTDEFEEVLRTTKDHATVHRLESGKSYRFRVQGVNPDGMLGGFSPTVVVHTMLETPAAPSEGNIESKQLVLTWKGRSQFVHSKDKALVKSMLGQWAGQLEEEGGVSCEVAFSKYDRDRSGSIDRVELIPLLEDLGVEPSEERIAQAFLTMDANKDGIITYEEFCDWWQSRDVVYTIKRSEALAPLSKKAAALNTSVASLPRSVNGETQGKNRRVPLPVVSYRGNQRNCSIAGLMPNRMYHFALRLTGPRSRSMLSAPLVVMTTSMTPAAPVLVRVTSNTVLLKWYAPEYGVYKFNVQLQSKDDKWTTVYSGPDTTFTSTTLTPDCEYAARVIGVNYQGRESEPSKTCMFRTFSRNSSAGIFTVRTADADFSVECTGDISVGDTVIITERLYARDGAKISQSNLLSGSMASMNSSVISNARSVGKGTKKAADTALEEDIMTLNPGVFIGERTIAAHVIRDNYRTAREAAGGSISDKKFFTTRRLWLEVVWQKASNDGCKPYELKAGVVIERQLAQIEKFEVFRAAWKDETLRRSLREELVGLSECYFAY